MSVKEITHEEFVERFEKPRVPCILTDAMDDWPASGPGPREWTWDNLRDRFALHKFKVGRCSTLAQARWHKLDPGLESTTPVSKFDCEKE